MGGFVQFSSKFHPGQVCAECGRRKLITFKKKGSDPGLNADYEFFICQKCWRKAKRRAEKGEVSDTIALHPLGTFLTTENYLLQFCDECKKGKDRKTHDCFNCEIRVVYIGKPNKFEPKDDSFSLAKKGRKHTPEIPGECRK